MPCCASPRKVGQADPCAGDRRPGRARLRPLVAAEARGKNRWPCLLGSLVAGFQDKCRHRHGAHDPLGRRRRADRRDASRAATGKSSREFLGIAAFRDDIGDNTRVHGGAKGFIRAVIGFNRQPNQCSKLWHCLQWSRWQRLISCCKTVAPPRAHSASAKGTSAEALKILAFLHPQIDRFFAEAVNGRFDAPQRSIVTHGSMSGWGRPRHGQCQQCAVFTLSCIAQHSPFWARS
mgnify:CR=1 FL=1